MALNDKVSFTWVGHGTWLATSAAGKKLVLDPWVMNNPVAPEHLKNPDRVDIMAVTHGHFDHIHDAVELARKHSCKVLAIPETAGWLGKKGVENIIGFNKGGTVDVDGVKITLTHAFHSGSAPDGSYAGEPSGLIVNTEDDKTLYFAGDTNVFGDMQLIGRIYEPDVAVLPIGDHFTMGPKEAAVAVELLGVKRVIPCHWGTFGLLTGTPEEFEQLAPSGVTIETMQPGETVAV